MYDYVIVGAGSAGCVLAARLSEDPGVRVCLVEAGPSDDLDRVRIPVAAGGLFRTRYDWDYDTHDEPHCEGRRIYLPRGRMIGGTSSMNGMVYMRGAPDDYDGWRVPGWRYADLLPYFLRAEDNERGPSQHHATGGPLGVADGRSNNPMSRAFLQAAAEAGRPANDDFNAGDQEGFGRYQLTQRDGRRCSASAAYLRPVLHRPNLTVEQNLLVARVVVGADGRAGEVIAHRLDTEVRLRAEREVILAAGAYNSPQLLMLSGIGPADLLRSLGIPVVADHPDVGRNLQDHPAANLVFAHDEPVSLLTANRKEYVRQFDEHGSGPLSSNVPEVGGFVRTTGALAAPDVQFHACPVMLLDGGLDVGVEHGFSFGPCVLQPASRGQVTIVSDDPTAKPRIRHNYYAEPADLDAMVRGLRVALDIAGQPALKAYTTTAVRVPDSCSDADLRSFARRATQTLFHPAGTCALGRVVDEQARVRGVDGLRVVDASILPTIVRGNPNAPIIAMAERAADLIRQGAP